MTQLIDQGELPDADIRNNYVTFLASIFRSVRFGGASAHGRANLMQLNFLSEKGAFDFDAETGTYSVNLETMKDAVNELAGRILTFQGDGDYEGLGRFNETYGSQDDRLGASLERVRAAGIPVDRRYLFGFSNGGYFVSYLTLEGWLAIDGAAMVASGRLFVDESLLSPIKPPLYLAVGSLDSQQVQNSAQNLAWVLWLNDWEHCYKVHPGRGHGVAADDFANAWQLWTN